MGAILLRPPGSDEWCPSFDGQALERTVSQPYRQLGYEESGSEVCRLRSLTCMENHSTREGL
jgi:hypothetical protein